MKLLRTAFALLLISAAAQAELKWERPIQEFQRTPEDKFVEARFAFKNTGKSPVTIRNTRTSCGCTTAKLEKKTYAPGESGEIVARFDFGGRKGYQRKTVTVYTDRNEEPAVVLDLRVNVEPPFSITPSLVFWKVGEPPAPKEVELSANGHKVKVKSVTSSNPRVETQLKTAKDGERYTLLVTPAGTERKESAELKVETDFPPDEPRTYSIYVRIK